MNAETHMPTRMSADSRGWVRVAQRRRPGALAAAMLFSVLLWSGPASAQYFGQNKVQYKRFDFQVLQTEHFDVYFYPEERAGVDIASRLAERWYARLERFFGHSLRGRQPLVLYASHADFEQNNVIQGAIGEGTGGVTESVRRRIVLPLDGSLADIDHVIGHELVHAFQFDITSSPGARGGDGGEGAGRLPLWFIEGMAEYLSLGPSDAATVMWLRDAARAEKLPSIEDLDNPRYFPYRWGHAFWAYVGGRWGDEVIPQMLVAAARSGDVDGAIEQVLGTKTKELSAEWQTAIRERYQPLLASATPPDKLGRVVVKAAGLGGELNVGPAVSPDGRLIAFLSTRSVFSIDLYVADTATGRILRKLTDTATDPHYSSLQFIYSAGAWDPASRRLAAAAVAKGRPVLAIFDVERGVREREAPVPGVDGILNPTWAPDGRAIAFTGTRGGLTDLYVYDLATSSLRALTSDAYADLQPAWSPDGARLAFATDRFSTRLDDLRIGELRLATIDVASGRIEPVQALGGKQINPQWSPDGRSIYFISDRDGAANVYRAELATGHVTQLTTIATGVSGITGSSPAMSVSQKTGVIALSVYDHGKHAIHAIEGELMGQPPGPVSAMASMLPPVDRRSSQVAELLADATTGLPPATDFPVTDYSPRLSLEQVGQPMIALGASRFGAAIGGGLSFSFGDMLGDHTLQTAVQFNSLTGNVSVRDVAGEVAYVNRSRRWNWGLAGGQIPYLSGGFDSGLMRVGGRLVGVDRLIVNRQTERSASALVAYPFDRARRVEFQGGLTQVAFDQTVQTTAYDPFTGAVLSVDTTTSSLAQPLVLATSSAAFVTDTSNFGATSPVSGARSRFEVSPAIGTIAYTGVLADARRYFMPAPFYTFAVRGLHYGRYGSGGEDARLFPLYLGYPSLVRGYDVNSFDARDCVPDATSTCPAFDRLMGSRMLVGNVEFRFPLLRPFGASGGMYGPLPVEVAFFADGGVAWTRDDTPAFLGGSRTGVSSAGVALRVNLFGFAVGELDFVRPFQRTSRGWMVQFNLVPGF